MIIIAHLLIFAAIYGLLLPALHAVFGGSIDLHGGIITIVVISLLSEGAVLIGAFGGRALTLALKLNPLVNRRQFEHISRATLIAALSLVLIGASHVVPHLVSIAWYWAIALSILSALLLEVALRIKRNHIRASYK